MKAFLLAAACGRPYLANIDDRNDVMFHVTLRQVSGDPWPKPKIQALLGELSADYDTQRRASDALGELGDKDPDPIVAGVLALEKPDAANARRPWREFWA